MTVDVMVAVWMMVMGDRLDSGSLITSVMTLGGHHLLVLTLSLIGFGLFAGLAPATRGFADASPLQLAAIPVAGVVSAVALAGLLSVAALAGFGLAALLALVFGWRPSHRIDLIQRRR